MVMGYYNKKERIKMDKSNMSEEFHDWLEQCPVAWSKKHGEATYTFWEDEHDSIEKEK